jgi:hypothetical protein
LLNRDEARSAEIYKATMVKLRCSLTNVRKQM